MSQRDNGSRAHKFMGTILLVKALLFLATGSVFAIRIQLAPVGGVGSFNQPLFLTHAGDNSGRLFIVEQGGRIRIIDDSGNVLGSDFLNIGSSGLNLCTEGLYGNSHSGNSYGIILFR